VNLAGHRLDRAEGPFRIFARSRGALLPARDRAKSRLLPPWDHASTQPGPRGVLADTQQLPHPATGQREISPALKIGPAIEAVLECTEQEFPLL
jgi:hypothetical protein